MASPNKQMIEFLIDEFADAMENQNVQGQSPAFDVAVAISDLAMFRKFCMDYLNEHRPQQLLTNIDGNYGVQLTNLKQFLVSPPADNLKGTMQAAAHVGVTGAETANDMQQAGALPITGASALIPPGAVDFTKSQPAQTLTKPTEVLRYDTVDPRS